MIPSPNIGRGPLWNYGTYASFGLWTSARAESKMFVALYKGVLFARKTTFIWIKPPKDATGGTGDAGGDTETTGSSGGTGGTGEASFSFKQKISAKIVKFPASGSEVAFAEFPITIFASSGGVAGGTGDSGEGSIIYCDDAMTSFKKFGKLKETEFYRNSSGDAASDFVLPMPDAAIYDVDGGSGSSSSTSGESGGTGNSGVVEEIKRGLLTPLWRIDVAKTSTESLIISEVLNLHAADTFFFEERQLPGATGDTGGTGGTGETGGSGEAGDTDPCANNGEGGGDGGGTGDVGSLGFGGEGWLGERGAGGGGGDPGKSPCPDDADPDFDYSGIDT